MVVVEKGGRIGWPVRCGEFLPSRDEIRATSPAAEGVEDLFNLPQDVRGEPVTAAEAVSPRGRTYHIPFSGHALRRDILDQYLARLAVDAGAEVKTSTAFLGLRGGVALTEAGGYDAPVVIGADGPLSTVARAAGFPRHPLLFPAMSATVLGDFRPVFRAYFGGIAPGGYAWVIPRKGEANIGLGVHPELRREGLAASFRRFLQGLGLDPKTKGVGGMVPMSGPLPTTVKGKVLLVGDAAGHVLPTSGGGIFTAMLCGRLAGRAAADHLLAGRPLEAYEGAWRTQLGDAFATAAAEFNLMIPAFRSDWLLERLFRLLGSQGLARCLRCQPIEEGLVRDLLSRWAMKVAR